MTGGAASAKAQREQFEADAARYGIPLADLLGTMDGRPDEFDVWPENEATVTMFLRCTTQWRYRPIGKGSMIAGLEYASLAALLQMFDIPDKQQMFDDLRAMELAVIDEINKDAP